MKIIGPTAAVEIAGNSYTARIDTGAARSCVDSRLVIGQPRLHRRRRTKSSIGIQRREYVAIEITLAGEKIITEFSVADRSQMSYPVLIGRDILAGHYLVDSTPQN